MQIPHRKSQLRSKQQTSCEATFLTTLTPSSADFCSKVLIKVWTSLAGGTDFSLVLLYHSEGSP